jgi:AcrR family transcriptional regulator
VREAAILANAWELLATKPVGDITIEELASGAGLSRPTFYFYFDSREAVIRVLAANVAERLRETVLRQLAGEATDVDPAFVVHRIAERYMQRWRAEGPILRAMVPLYESDPKHRAFWDGITGEIVDGLAAAIEAERANGRALSGPDAHDLARALVGMAWRAGYDLSLTEPSAETDTRVVDTLTIIWMRALYGTDSPVR